MAFKNQGTSSPGLNYLGKERRLRPREERRSGLQTFGRKLISVGGLAILVGLLLGGALLGGYRFLSGSAFFQITTVKIEGNRRLDAQYIQALSGVTYRTNLLALDVGNIEKQIEDHPWVASVGIKRNLPSEIIINITEREPVVLVNGTTGLFFLDKKGNIFAQAYYPEQLDFPVITGVEKEVDAFWNGDLLPWQKRFGQLAEMFDFVRHAGRGSAALPRQNISEINVAKMGEYVLFLSDRPFPIYLGTDIGVERYNRLAKILYWLYKKKEFSNVNFIRMDYMNNKVLVGKNNA